MNVATIIRMMVLSIATSVTVEVLESTSSPAFAASAARVSTGGIPANIRAAPSAASRRVGTIRDGSGLTVTCRTNGQNISGHVRQSAVWNHLSAGGFVADANVAWRGVPHLPDCGAAPPAGSAAPSRPAPQARAATGAGSASIRSTPYANAPAIGTVANGAALTITCRASGGTVTGRVRRSAVWNHLISGGYIADANVNWPPGSAVPGPCSAPALPVGPADPVPQSTAAFIAWISGPARQAMWTYHVPASVTIAQAMLESGLGASTLSRLDHNYFGIKCDGWQGPVAIGCRDYPTWECSDGRCYKTVASFRVYRSASASVRDHGYFLASNSRYAAAFRSWRSADAFIDAVHRAGYASSPGYAGQLKELMQRYDLYRYDR